MEQQTVNITQDQVARAAQAGVKLLNDDERVNVPPSLALSGDLTVLVGVLSSLASGQAVLANPQDLPQVDAGAQNDSDGGNGAEAPPAE